MKNFFNNPAWTKQVALSALVLGAALSTAHAQFVGYSTGFQGTDIINGVSTTANYNTTTNSSGTQPLAGQFNWGSNDSAVGTVVNPTPGTYQVNGGTTTVGAFDPAHPTSITGVIGGQYRNPGSTDPTSPDAVPSAASGGIVSLFHPVSAGAPQYVFTVDFDITASTSVAPGRDSFDFSLRNTTNATVAGLSLVSINFTPSTATTTDNISYKVGNGAAVPSGAAVTISPATTYHLQITVNSGANPTFTAALTGTNGVNLTPSGPVALGSGNVNQFSADWTVASQTIANGGYTGAGTNALEFDNVSVTVPEPSTYAMLALGVIGLAGMLRLRRKQA